MKSHVNPCVYVPPEDYIDYNAVILFLLPRAAELKHFPISLFYFFLLLSLCLCILTIISGAFFLMLSIFIEIYLHFYHFLASPFPFACQTFLLGLFFFFLGCIIFKFLFVINTVLVCL